MFNFIRGKHRWLWITVSLLCAGAFVLVANRLYTSADRPSSSAASFDGPSTSLEETIIVPTLDTPLPEGKSAIWCASFQLAWDRLKKDLAKGPIKVQNAQDVADRLNAAEYLEDGLDPANYYAAAGLVKDGIVKKILADMAQHFPDGPTPDLSDATVGAVAYGYLKARVTFDIPFFDNREAFTFTDSGGGQTRVRSFGLRKKDEDAYLQLRKQVSILHCPVHMFQKVGMPEFVLDLCKDSQPHQIVLARVDRKTTVAETLSDVAKRIKEKPTEKRLSECHITDTLLIPTMRWRILHHFKELEGKDKRLLNPSLSGLDLDTALQSIDFQLDRDGAEVSSETKLHPTAGGPRNFEFNRPFLVLMKKRGATKPFFVMWVENAELMQPW